MAMKDVTKGIEEQIEELEKENEFRKSVVTNISMILIASTNIFKAVRDYLK
jgi:hypothetical protein